MIPTLSYTFNKFKFNIQIPDPNNKPIFRILTKEYEGVDQRYPFENKLNKLNNSTSSTSSTYTEDPNEINKIRSHFFHSDLLKKLSSDKLSSPDKINLIKTSKLDCLDHLSDQIKSFDLKAGGLFKDWENQNF